MKYYNISQIVENIVVFEFEILLHFLCCSIYDTVMTIKYRKAAGADVGSDGGDKDTKITV